MSFVNIAYVCTVCSPPPALLRQTFMDYGSLYIANIHRYIFAKKLLRSSVVEFIQLSNFFQKYSF